MNRYVWVSLFLLLLFVALFVRSGNSDVREIRKSFNQLVDDFELREREELIEAGLAAGRIIDSFSQGTKIRISGLPVEISNRSDLQSAIIQARSNLDRFVADIADMRIDVSPDRESAMMSVSAYVSVSGMRRLDEEWHAVDVQWIKTDGKWEISSIDSLETIEHP